MEVIRSKLNQLETELADLTGQFHRFKAEASEQIEHRALAAVHLARRPPGPGVEGRCGQRDSPALQIPAAGIGMLGRQLHHHLSRTAAGLAADLKVGRSRLALVHADNLSVTAALDLSRQDITPGQQRLFRRLDLHPGTTSMITPQPPSTTPISARPGVTSKVFMTITSSRNLPGPVPLSRPSSPS